MSQSLEKTDKGLRDEVERLKAVNEVAKVMSRHAYYHSAGKHWEELEAIWARKTPGVSFGQDDSYILGMESIKRFYGEHHDKTLRRDLAAVRKLYPDIEDKPENYGIGTIVVHPLTTPLIEVSGDGRTAKGVWYSPGQVTELGPDGKPLALWMWEKYGVDFVREDGQWKIWHLHIYYDFAVPVGKSWADSAQEDKLVDLGPEADRPRPDLEVPGTYRGYSPTTVPRMVPRPPEPYRTFSQTFSYGP